MDKRRSGLTISPDEIKVEIKIAIVNKSNKNIFLPLRKDNDLFSSYFYGYVNYNERTDSFMVVNHFLPDGVFLGERESFNNSFVSTLYDFENLFPNSKDDYTEPMLKLLEKLHFKYFYINADSLEIISFAPDSLTTLISNNTY